LSGSHNENLSQHGMPTPEPEQEELLDRPSLPFEQRQRALADLARFNRWALGYLPVLRTLLPRLRAAGGRGWLLDVGTGSGETAAEVARAVVRRGGALRVVGVDSKLPHLLIGRRRAPGQLRVAASAEALPFRDRSFDWTLSTLFFHHFDAAGNARVLSEMRRTARRAAVVVDLRRGWLTRWLARWLLPLSGMGPTARHDGRISAGRAYDLAGVSRVVEGMPVLELSGRFPRRFSLVLAGGFSATGKGRAGQRTCEEEADVRE